MKTCTKCGETKPYSEYHVHKKTKDGFKSSCKVCRNLESSAYRKANPEKATASWKTWKENNLELSKERARAWRLANLDKAKARSAAWYLANAEKTKARAAAWYLANIDRAKANAVAYLTKRPEVFKTAAQNRRARKLKAGGRLSKDLSSRLFALQRGKCACCGKPLGNKYHMDHIVPLVLGGSNTDDNIQLLRAQCNLQKSTKHPIDFMQERGHLL